MENKKTIMVNGKKFTIENRYGDVKIDIDGTTFVSINPTKEKEKFKVYVFENGYEEEPSYRNMIIDTSSKHYEKYE